MFFLTKYKEKQSNYILKVSFYFYKKLKLAFIPD